MLRALLLCFFVGAANAATIDPLLAKSDVCGRFELYHINGVMTDPTDAADNLNRIRAVYGNSYKEHIIVYRLAYNQHRSFLRDFYDSAMQIINLYAQATWDKWMNAVTFGVYAAGMPQATSQAIAKQVTDLWGFTKPNPYTDQEMNEIMSVIVSGSAPHARKVLLPHSQGNFYASLVYDKLVATGHAAKSIGIVGLAVPYSSVRTGNVYITSAQDLIIDSVRVATLGNVLVANANIPYAPTVDVFGHNLIDTYMANSIVRDKYKTLITNEFATLTTTAPPPRFPYLHHAMTHWFNCGPGSPHPYGCMVNGKAIMLPMVQFYPIGKISTSSYDIVTISPATMGDAASAAASNAAKCQSQAVSAYKSWKTTGIWPSTLTAGCGPGAGDAWHAYSGDATLTKTTTSENHPNSGSAIAMIGPVCRN